MNLPADKGPDSLPLTVFDLNRVHPFKSPDTITTWMTCKVDIYTSWRTSNCKAQLWSANAHPTPKQCSACLFLHSAKTAAHSQAANSAWAGRPASKTGAAAWRSAGLSILEAVVWRRTLTFFRALGTGITYNAQMLLERCQQSSPIVQPPMCLRTRY